MALTFYYGSGSPFAWKVWLVLHHKGIAHEARRLHFDRGDHKTAEFLALNPRGKVPAIDHDGYVLWESSAIVDYLEAAFPGRSVWPSSPRALGSAKRIAFESDNHLYPVIRRLLVQTLFKPDGDGDPNEIRLARTELAAELERFAGYLQGDFFAGELSAADYAVYPQLRMVARVGEKQPQHGVPLPAPLEAFRARVDALPYTSGTEPPHWKQP